MNELNKLLQHHVSGAIERGEKEAITAQESSERYEFNVDAAICAAIVNDDMSGLNESECNCIESFCERYRLESIIEESGDNIKRCEVTGLAADCVRCYGVSLTE